MSRDNVSIIDRLLLRRSLRQWRLASERVDQATQGLLRHMRPQARQLKREVDRFLNLADARLAGQAANAHAVRRPDTADWAWRPEVWCVPVRPSGFAGIASGTAIGRALKLFHDCGDSEISLRQLRNSGDVLLAPYSLRMDVFRFAGSYLSLVMELPEAAVRTLGVRHILRMDSEIDLEAPLEIFARLNIGHGPNTEQIVRELPRGQGETSVEFDLGYARINEKRIERAWVDLIFEGPQMNQITLRDVTFSRRPRAAL
jgi:hypothetical protein